MKSRYWIASVTMAAFMSLACSVIGQTAVPTRDKYLITAKAGGVNLVSGDVTVERADGRSGRLLKGDEVQIGDRVTTGSDGRAEILMNPGSYVRLGADSSFEFVSTDLDDVRLKMHSGSAILEVFGTEGFYVGLSTDTARFTILETGVYRIDASPKGNSTVAVWKGKLRAGTLKNNTLGGGKLVRYDGRTYSIVKFDREDKDALAVWSRDRSKELARVSATLSRDRLRDPLINSFNNNRWNLYNSFGLWVYDPFFRSFCFLPFGWGWSSPYGFGYGRSIWYYNLPVAIYQQPPPSDGKVPRRDIGRPVVTDGNARGNDAKVSPDVFKHIQRERPAEPRYDPPPRAIEPIFVPSMPAPDTKTPTRRP